MAFEKTTTDRNHLKRVDSGSPRIIKNEKKLTKKDSMVKVFKQMAQRDGNGHENMPFFLKTGVPNLPPIRLIPVATEIKCN